MYPSPHEPESNDPLGRTRAAGSRPRVGFQRQRPPAARRRTHARGAGGRDPRRAGGTGFPRGRGTDSSRRDPQARVGRRRGGTGRRDRLRRPRARGQPGARLRHLFPGHQHRRARASHPPPARLRARWLAAAAGQPARRAAGPARGGRRSRRGRGAAAELVHRAGVHRAPHRGGAPGAAAQGAGPRGLPGRRYRPRPYALRAPRRPRADAHGTHLGLADRGGAAGAAERGRRTGERRLLSRRRALSRAAGVLRGLRGRAARQPWPGPGVAIGVAFRHMGRWRHGRQSERRRADHRRDARGPARARACRLSQGSRASVGGAEPVAFAGCHRSRCFAAHRGISQPAAPGRGAPARPPRRHALPATAGADVGARAGDRAVPSRRLCRCRRLPRRPRLHRRQPRRAPGRARRRLRAAAAAAPRAGVRLPPGHARPAPGRGDPRAGPRSLACRPGVRSRPARARRVPHRRRPAPQPGRCRVRPLHHQHVPQRR